MTTLKDAYIAEILGQILELEQRMEQLPARLETATLALTQATDEFQKHIDAYMLAQQEVLLNNIQTLASNSIRSTAAIQEKLISQAVEAAFESRAGFESRGWGQGLIAIALVVPWVLLVVLWWRG
jgi:hypothetical protein